MSCAANNIMQRYGCSAETAKKYIDLRDEGYPQHAALLMAGLSDPPDHDLSVSVAKGALLGRRTSVATPTPSDVECWEQGLPDSIDRAMAAERIEMAAPELLEIVQNHFRSLQGGYVMTFSEADEEWMRRVLDKATGGAA